MIRQFCSSRSNNMIWLALVLICSLPAPGAYAERRTGSTGEFDQLISRVENSKNLTQAQSDVLLVQLKDYTDWMLRRTERLPESFSKPPSGPLRYQQGRLASLRAKLKPDMTELVPELLPLVTESQALYARYRAQLNNSIVPLVNEKQRERLELLERGPDPGRVSTFSLNVIDAITAEIEFATSGRKQPMPVTGADGVVTNTEVWNFWPFALIADGRFLEFDGEAKQIRPMKIQPKGHVKQMLIDLGKDHADTTVLVPVNPMLGKSIEHYIQHSITVHEAKQAALLAKQRQDAAETAEQKQKGTTLLAGVALFVIVFLIWLVRRSKRNNVKTSRSPDSLRL